MGTTRATGVRCPWCATPIGEGADRPQLCPSCGVPLARPLSVSAHPVTFAVPAARRQRSQRLRSTAAVLGLTSVILTVSAIPLGLAIVRHDGGDQRATANLLAVLRAAEEVRRETGQFTGALPVVLQGRVFGTHVVDGQTSSTNAVVSMAVSTSGDAWYGAVRSTSGRCFAAATITGNPTMLRTVLPGNCTGGAAQAALMPLGPPTP
jgi:hypothetical protein